MVYLHVGDPFSRPVLSGGGLSLGPYSVPALLRSTSTCEPVAAIVARPPLAPSRLLASASLDPIHEVADAPAVLASAQPDGRRNLLSAIKPAPVRDGDFAERSRFGSTQDAVARDLNRKGLKCICHLRLSVPGRKGVERY